MAVHITDKQLGKYIAGILPEDESAPVRAHIESCEKCSRAYSLMNGISSDRSGRVPSPFLRARVLASCDKIAAEKTDRSPLRKYIAASAAAAVLIAAGLSLYYYSAPQENIPVFFSASDPDRALRKEGAGSIIKAERSSRSILIDRICDIKIFPGSELSIVRSEKINGRHKFYFKASYGKIISFFEHNAGADYSFETPHALISSSGTEILISVNKNYTGVMIGSGIAEVTSLANGKKTACVTGSKYTITDDILTAKADESDVQKFKTDAVMNQQAAGSSAGSNKHKMDGLTDKNPAGNEDPGIAEHKSGAEKSGREKLSKEIREEKHELKNFRKDIRDNRRRGKKEK